MEYKWPMSEKIIITILLLAVAFCAYAVASCFAGLLDRRVFCAGVTIGSVAVSTQAVVVSTETIRGEQ